VFIQGKNQILSGPRRFQHEDQDRHVLGASGIANIRPPRLSPFSGGYVAPQITNQDTDVYFFGEIVEKLGPKKYKITNGRLHHVSSAGTALGVSRRIGHAEDRRLHAPAAGGLRRERCAGLLSADLYYPTNKEGRATGFLLPSYSSTSLRGPSIRNEFFWAIGRSHDATFTYDWYSKTGQGTAASTATTSAVAPASLQLLA
jgi:hypothetical protein